MDFNIAVVHNQVFGQEIFQIRTVNYVKLAITLEPINEVIHTSFILIPILLVLLHFTLGAREILIKLLEIVVVVKL